jgi:hypothetical protein
VDRTCQKANVLLAVIWFAFVARALFYCTVFPLWEGFDEYGHVAVIQHIFYFRDIPDFRHTNTSRQIAESRGLVPAPWLLHDDSKGLLSYEEYWQLSPNDRMVREARLRELPQLWATEVAEPETALYEAQQPPLYYWLLLPLYWCIKSLDVPTQVWLMRCCTALLASCAIPISFLAARRYFSDLRIALGVTVVVASVPQLVIDAFRVSNEGLAIAIGSAAVLVGLRLWDSRASIRNGLGWGSF